jgi:hypothetical protein
MDTRPLEVRGHIPVMPEYLFLLFRVGWLISGKWNCKEAVTNVKKSKTSHS